MHDLLFQDFPEDYPWLDRKIYGAKVEHAVQSSDHIVAISEVTKSDLMERYHVSANKISVQYQFCAHHFLEERTEGQILRVRKKFNLSRPYLLCVSSFSHRKNQSRLVEAFHDSGLWSDYDLVLIGGDNAYKKIIEKAVEDLDLINEIKMPTVFDNNELASLYQGCSLIIYPSLKEGFGIPVVEGMASKKPVITSKNTSCAEAGGHAVETFDPHDEEDISRTMQRILNDADLQQDMVSRGLVRLGQLSPKKEIAKLAELYHRLTANG